MDAQPTYHFLVGQLAALDAAAVPYGLLVAPSLRVAEEVHLRGDLKKQREMLTLTSRP